VAAGGVARSGGMKPARQTPMMAIWAAPRARAEGSRGPTRDISTGGSTWARREGGFLCHRGAYCGALVVMESPRGGTRGARRPTPGSVLWAVAGHRGGAEGMGRHRGSREGNASTVTGCGSNPIADEARPGGRDVGFRRVFRLVFYLMEIVVVDLEMSRFIELTDLCETRKESLVCKPWLSGKP